MQNTGIITVLGSPNDARGNLSSVAVSRCGQALRLWHDNPDWRILLTGGYGPHFNTTRRPHAQYLKEYLTAQGVPAASILEFAESRNTLEDAALSKPIVLSQGVRTVVVITSDYHLERARFVFRRDFAGTAVSLLFIGVATDEDRCELDLVSLKKHEREALKKMMEESPAQSQDADQRIRQR